MTVTRVTSDGKPVRFVHQNNVLTLPLATPSMAGRHAQFTIAYHGAPAGGLRILPNKHGDWSAFSENWPNHARDWLPIIDHPYDKATSEFIVTAPAKFQVVANGLLLEETDLGDGRRRTHWKQSVPIASWLNALGVEQFAVLPRRHCQRRRAADVGGASGRRRRPRCTSKSPLARRWSSTPITSARIRTRSSPTSRRPG